MSGLTWEQPHHDGPMVAMSGRIAIGAVVDGAWGLYFVQVDGTAATPSAACAALEAAWAQWMLQAGLAWADKGATP